MVAGTGLPSLLAAVGDARSYAERLFSFATINNLTQHEAVDALVLPAQHEGVQWTSRALEIAIEAAKGYPYFLQEIGKHTWELASGPIKITSEDVEVALPVAVEAFGDFVTRHL